MVNYGNPVDQLYMWLRERVTEEVVIEGHVYGVVMNGQQLGLAQLGEVVNRSKKVTSQYIKKLESNHMILIKRVSHGQAFFVRVLNPTVYFQKSIQGDIKERKLKVNGSRAEDEVKVNGSRVEDEVKVNGSRVEGEMKVNGNRAEGEVKVNGSRVEDEVKMNGNTAEISSSTSLKNKELKESIKNLLHSFYSFGSIDRKDDQQDEASVERLLAEGLSEEQIKKWVCEEYERVRGSKRIVVFRYFEQYLRSRYQESIKWRERVKESEIERKTREWQANKADRETVRKYIQEVREHAKRLR